jgi:hypothetical protein
MCWRDMLRVGDNDYVPTITDVWDFLLGFKSATEAGFARVEGRLDRVEGRLDRVEGRLDRVEVRLGHVEGSLGRIESRVIRIECWNVDRRLDDHEQRILRLERHSLNE